MRIKIIISILIWALLLFIIPTIISVGYAHIEGKAQNSEHNIILSRNTDDNIKFKADSQSDQWKKLSSETDVTSLWGHNISVRTLNNGTYLFFMLSWHDDTGANNNKAMLKSPGIGSSRNSTINIDQDGAAIIFQLVNATEQTGSIINRSNYNIWYWSTQPVNKSKETQYFDSGLITSAEWDKNDNQWHVVIGKVLPDPRNNIKKDPIAQTIGKPGILQKDFVKFAVWDGAKRESFPDAFDNKEKLTHLDYLLLQPLNLHPNDVYFWSVIFIIGPVLFVIIELRLSRKSTWQTAGDKKSEASS